MAVLSASRKDRQQLLLTLAIAVGTVVITIAGWRLFWFLTDDAYIAFRYVSNSLNGRGLVWNPAPFKPVEGYTSFLWVVLLREVWRFTGVEPPDSANFIALLFGLATLFLGYRFVMLMRLPAAFERWRLAFASLALLGTVTNRTFLAWISSGLETALFNFLFTWWIYEGVARDRRGTPTWTLRVTAAAALCALCRPDGLLIVAATVVMLLLERPRWPALAGAVPLLAVPAHMVWRHAVYGEWLPNTYYAKHTSAWPEAGLRYLGCFILEYGVWWWIGLALLWLVAELRKGVPCVGFSELSRMIPAATLLAHAAYYTLIIGGDHFEYRVYSHLILLMFVSAVWLISGLTDRVSIGASVLAGFMLVSYPIPWLHWWKTKDRDSRKETYALHVSLADAFPPPLRSVVGLWDSGQAWLATHLVGARHQEHKVYWQSRLALYPSREEGEKIPWSDRDVYPSFNVGVVGWVLPNVAIIDKLGLNDWVIARVPPPAPTSAAPRQMAHERRPPPGYAECFRPNVQIRVGRVIVEPRDQPLTDDEIRACESIDWAAASSH